MVGNAKQRHCLKMQHKILNIVSSFLGSRLPAARGTPGTRATGCDEQPQATRVAASITGYMSTPKAPK